MVFLVQAFRRTVAISVTSAAIALSPLLSVVAQAQALSGAGATFPAPLYERYFSEFQDETGIQVDYQAIGSGGGVRQVIAGTVDFGGSDAAMTDAQIEQVEGGVILVPTAGGAVAVVYNLPGVSELRLPRSVYPAIFAGQITRWNDSRIAEANPGVELPDLPIRTVVRADGSGTTFIFTNHLSAVDPYFRGRVGVGTAPRWTTNPIQGRGNPGVAAQVARTEGAIGYVEYAYAKQNNLSAALVENGSGEFIAPSLETTEQALSSVEFPDNFRVFVEDSDEGYPIAGLTWMIVYRQYDNAETAASVRELVEWVLTDGQEINNQLDYTRIPTEVAQEAISQVNDALGGN
jgi:phosphate transport system substrate-binding protein